MKTEIDKQIAELIAYMQVQEAEGEFIIAKNCKRLPTVGITTTHYLCPESGPWVNNSKQGSQLPVKYDGTIVAIPADTTLPLKEAAQIKVLREVTLKRSDTRHLDLEEWAQENKKTGDWVVLKFKPRTPLNRLTKRPVTLIGVEGFGVEPIGAGTNITISPSTYWLYPADVEVNLPPCEFEIIHEFTVEPETRRVTFGEIVGCAIQLENDDIAAVIRKNETWVTLVSIKGQGRHHAREFKASAEVPKEFEDYEFATALPLKPSKLDVKV